MFVWFGNECNRETVLRQYVCLVPGRVSQDAVNEYRFALGYPLAEFISLDNNLCGDISGVDRNYETVILCGIY